MKLVEIRFLTIVEHQLSVKVKFKSLRREWSNVRDNGIRKRDSRIKSKRSRISFGKKIESSYSARK